MELGVAARRAVFEVKRRTVVRSSDRALRILVANERRDPSDLLRQQRERAIDHARFAMQNTRFYRELYGDAGLSAADLHDPAAFDALPIVTKDDVRERFDDFVTPEATARTSAVSKTGGSTGEPTRILRDTRVSAQPLEWRLFRWWGVYPADNMVIVFRQIKSSAEQRNHALRWWPTRRVLMDAYNLTDEIVVESAKNWRRLRPTLLTGYAGGILAIARTIERLGLTPPPFTAVATTASPLTAEARADIERILGAPAYDHYRSSEMPWMGGECVEREGHHLFVEGRYLQLVDHADNVVTPGDEGTVIATDLTNRVFPLIRYRLGDRTHAIDTPCSCGVTLPRFARIMGRATDGIHLPDGTWVPGIGLYQLFNDFPGAVRQFQVDQLLDYSVVLRCIAGPSPEREQSIEAATRLLGRLLHDKVPVSWEIVPAIPDVGGKVQYVRTAVPGPASGSAGPIPRL